VFVVNAYCVSHSQGVGASDGFFVGAKDGGIDGERLGLSEGANEGELLGLTLGATEGLAEGP